MNNKRGSTLVEGAVTALIIGIATLMICSAFLTSLAINENTQEEYDRVSNIYDNIELGTSAYDSSWEAEQSGSITITYAGGAISIPGTYTYDSQSEKLGEFIRSTE